MAVLVDMLLWNDHELSWYEVKKMVEDYKLKPSDMLDEKCSDML